MKDEESPEHLPALADPQLRLRQCSVGPMMFRANDHYIGRSLDFYGEFSPGESALYRKIVGDGDTVVDAGANIGCFSVLFGKLVGPQGRVYAFEPQRHVFQTLCANLALNGLHNVDAWPMGLGASIEKRVIARLDYNEWGNFGAPSLTPDGEGDTVSVTTIDALELESCRLIKADVQGMERDVLLGAVATIEQFRPMLYLENDLLEKSPALLSTVFEMGYRAFWHLPPLCEPDNFRAETRNIFGNTVSVNVLCVPDNTGWTGAALYEIRRADDWWQNLQPA